MIEKNSIALIGFMATGKSEVGKALTEKLGVPYEFIEMDELIEHQVGKPIHRIFSEDGEIRFRELEIAMCKKLSEMKKKVISCGGGIVLNKINIDYLKKNCIIILLTASKEEIYRRIMKDGKEIRPKINKPNVKKEIEELLSFRKPFYLAHADYQIDTTNKTIDEIVDLILKKTKIK
ncbi:MAG: shikimate kinase [Promethearchaeota archaeon]